ncbi:HD domain-containing protein [Arcticibacterium luteifluviistationis]|uniref:Phosphohydrolase n=1 Tax=Arcticibacterium luteifluviistationis TaxID=1784714 RepID=A0A2Z4GH02_9BACT|nr:HDIG domain-containing metalloprotein [Arcticibacterium luteifluviistationis]AWW00358.1 phosphohydrolase [Arcticibacterium luteifluviistationis]
MEKEILVSDVIRDIFERKAHEAYYGEEVTQLQHAVQAYQLAKEKNADLELCIGAFLHDIGHMIDEDTEELGAIHHEQGGATWLAENGFSERIVAVAGEHVNAKRYLCYKYLSYRAKLSEASKATLILQGGIMKPSEAAVFQEHPYFDDIILVRLWDEQAKDKNKEPINTEIIYNQIDQLFQ